MAFCPAGVLPKKGRDTAGIPASQSPVHNLPAGLDLV